VALPAPHSQIVLPTADKSLRAISYFLLTR
jgi:hypothetical protein